MTSQPHDGPTRVGDYTLLTRLGEGGMGIVHLARGADGRRVALKVLRPHVVGDAEARARLAREVGSLSRVRSPWVAEILAADPWGEMPYVVTRYVPGLSLHDHVQEEGPVADRDLLWLAGCLAEGVEAVHAAGVLHRDVKPSNVLMEGRTPILIDFGLARVAEDPRLTQTGWLLGTPGYLAPEILYGDEATPAADVHAWAATVAYAATGQAPYGRGPAMAIMDRARRGEHDLSGIDRPLADVLDAALSPDPLERPLLEELLAWLRPLSTRPSDPRVPPPGGGVLGGVGEQVDDDDFTLPLALAAQAGVVVPPVPPVPAGEVATATPITVVDHVRPGAVAAAPPAPPTTPVTAPPAPVGDGTGTERLESERPESERPESERWSSAADGREGARTQVLADGSREWPPPPPRDGDDALSRMEEQWDRQWEEPDGAARTDVPALERVRRGLAVTAGAFVVGAGLAAAPWLTLIGVVAMIWLLRAGSLASSAVAGRRQVRGRKWHDGLAWVFSSPWHLLRATTGTLVLTVWSAGLALAAGLLCYAFALDLPTSLLVSGTTLGVALWSGPGSDRFRRPVGRALYPATGRPVAWLVLCAALVVTGSLLAMVAVGQGTWWAPADSGPFGLG
ncbi:serine/threonine-protein kinase [Nocardioides sambongensis]|uniref:serine/threonine-protein kinase n=1 Tax=Nocardioides sambongensis TaxID=2589074 RepID=UPI0015E86E23|nr:serine/threonine-protein kinase [Nocardioides sambongensis]